MRKIIASLDIGSSYIKLVVGEIHKQKLNILAAIDTPSHGIKNGYIVNYESAIESIKETFEKASVLIGIEIKKIIVTVPSAEANCFYSEGTISLQSEDKIVTHKDLIRSMQDAAKHQVADNHELITILPTSFVVNDIDKVSNPVGLTAEKLTVKAIGVTVPKKNIIGINKCLEKLNIEVVDNVVGSLGDYYELKTPEMKNSVGAIINIGGNKTEVSIFNKGILTNTSTLNMGGKNIDYEIYNYYKVTRKEAEYIKDNLALAHKNMAQASEFMMITNKLDEEIKINQYDVSEMTMNKLIEILNFAKKEINLLTKKEISYIMVTGGITELSDLNILLEEMFKQKAKIGSVYEIGIRNNKYSSSAGLIKYYNSRLKLRGTDFSVFNLDEQAELSGYHKKVNISDNSLLGKVFGYFFDN